MEPGDTDASAHLVRGYNKDKNQSIVTDSETTHLLNRQHTKTVVITVFHILKKLEGRLSILNRDMEDIKRLKSNFWR